jgi:hypothetical protein
MMDIQMKKSVFFGTQRFITSENPTFAEPFVYSCGQKKSFAEGA